MDLREAIKKAYAKSTGETVREHTDKLHERLQRIKQIRGDEITALCPQEWQSEFWNLAETIIEYHDYGKLHSPFQQRVIKIGKLEPAKYKLIDVSEVPHNFLSPCFLPEDVIRKYQNLLPVIIQAIAYHHDRDIDERMFKIIIDEIADRDLSRFKNPIFLKYWQYLTPQKYLNPKDQELFKLLVLLKGLLHRTDYTASGDIDVEMAPDNIADIIISKLQSTGNNLTGMQNFVLKNADKDLLVLAPTGAGKTEAGALYINKNKGFFILPLRVSIDSIYDRLTGTAKEQSELRYGIKNIGLMHSTSLFRRMGDIEQKDSDIRENAPPAKNFEQIYKAEQETKNLSFPFSITTPDQIFPFVFKYGGFERIYSTLGYSKIVVDEIQMFNPKMLAYMLKGLQTIKELGGKIMIMTATFPEFLKKELEGLNIIFGESKIFCDNKLRHYVKAEKDKDILNEEIMRGIEADGQEKKTLVICNTVNKAVEVYNQLKNENKFLLHSRFIQKHRRILENDIQYFAPNDSKKRDSKAGVWITTQIAEVSLNIDFDILYTELSSIDSLIQRMGRVNRSRRYTPDKPNVIVCCKKKEEDDKNGCSGIGSIYDEKIFDLTHERIADGALPENKKMELVELIYDYEKIRLTKYYSDFKDSLTLINEIWEVGKIYNPIESIRQAQRQFREVFTVTLIPQQIYSNAIETFEKIKIDIKSKNLAERVDARKRLTDFTVSIPWHYLQKIKPSYFVNDIYIAPFKYDFDETVNTGVGLSVDMQDENNFSD